MGAGPGRSRRPQFSGVVNLLAATAVLLLVATLALRASSTQPPAIAEFAPQAQQQIKQAPAYQTSLVGQGDGGAGIASPSPSPLPSALVSVRPSHPATIDPGRVRKCIGDPPRQIEDPQSPPCVPYFSGDNGGATYPGVTGDSITIAVPKGGAEPPGLMQILADFFNKRFEFYGRKLVLQEFTPAGGSPDQMQADATSVRDKYGAFASTAYAVGGDSNSAVGGQGIYYDALAHEKIPSFDYETNFSAPGHVQSLAPYEYTFFPDLAISERNEAALICRGLKGHAATWAGPGSQGTRVFGIIGEGSSSGSSVSPDVSTLQNELQACGAPVPVVREINNFDAVGAQNAVIAMKSNNVTTIMCICNSSDMGNQPMQSAHDQAYLPEWITTDYVDQFRDYYAATFWPADQGQHTFGFSFTNKFLDSTQMPWYWATHEMNPNYGAAGSSQPYDLTDEDYSNFLQLASAIQMAGPHLTPDTMLAELRRARFPNPGADGPPQYQARVDYSAGNTFMQTSAAMWWYSKTAVSPVTQQPGTFCYVDGGVRHNLANWPTSPPDYFDVSRPCR